MLVIGMLFYRVPFYTISSRVDVMHVLLYKSEVVLPSCISFMTKLIGANYLVTVGSILCVFKFPIKLKWLDKQLCFLMYLWCRR